jgi:two-component system chemotaxis response regulator CheB
MRLVLLVADVGGPPALHDLLSQLPRQFKSPIVVLQSVDVGLLETSAAVLKRTIQLRVSLIEGATSLESGQVYFARPDMTYLLRRTPQQLLIEPVSAGGQDAALAQTVVSITEACPGEATAIFLSGTSRGQELASGCRALVEADCEILVLDRLEAVVSDMAKQVLKYAPSARELTIIEIVDHLTAMVSVSDLPRQRLRETK